MEADGAPFTLLPLSVLRFMGIKAIATRIRGKSKQTLKSPSIEPGTSCSESRALTNWNGDTCSVFIKYIYVQYMCILYIRDECAEVLPETSTETVECEY